MDVSHGPGMTGAPRDLPASPGLPDTLSDVLEVVRLTGALFFLVDARTPWVAEAPAASDLAPVILPRAQHVVSYHVVSAGDCWCESPGHAAMRLEAGDVLVVPHGDAYQLASARGLRTGWSPDDAVAWFRAMASGQLPFVVTEGGSGPERLRLVCGFLGCDALPFNPVLSALPPLMKVRVPADSAGRLKALLEFAVTESNERPCRKSIGAPADRGAGVRRGAPQLPDGGNERRHWLVGRLARPDCWPRAGEAARASPPVPGRCPTRTRGRRLALRAGGALHRLRGMSTDALPDAMADTARRQPARGGDRAGECRAGEVGYESEAAFCRAFKKVTGVTPGSWRSRRRVEST